MSTTNGTTDMVMHTAERVPAKAADQTRAFEPRDIGEGYELAKLLVASGLLPRGVQRPEAAFAIIAAGRELGLTAMQSLRSIHIIEGRPTLSADLIAALCKSRSDVCLYFRLVESTDWVARYETHRRGEPAPTSMSFSIEDAQRAGVTGKDNWRKYPAAMLRARCITALARAVYPDLAMGVYDPDEISVEPMPPPAPMHVISEPSPRTADQSDRLSYMMLASRVEKAASASELNAVARDATKAFKAGTLSVSDLDELKANVLAKRASLAKPAPAPEPPKPEEPSEADGYDANEAESEAMASQYDGDE